MANNRTDEVVGSIIAAVRRVIVDKGVTIDEYRTAVEFAERTAQAGEIFLFAEAFFNNAVVRSLNERLASSPSDIEGPYFIEDCPEVAGCMDRLEDDDAEPLLIRGTVRNCAGDPLPGATVFIWSSTPDGRYSGIDPGIPANCYRGKLVTDEAGAFSVETSTPVPYQIPNTGPTGELLEAMGRHSWRPAHVHFKIRAEGYAELTTQAYFAEDRYVSDDCCDAIVADELVFERKLENGKRLMEVSFALDTAHHAREAMIAA